MSAARLWPALGPVLRSMNPALAAVVVIGSSAHLDVGEWQRSLAGDRHVLRAPERRISFLRQTITASSTLVGACRGHVCAVGSIEALARKIASAKGVRWIGTRAADHSECMSLTATMNLPTVPETACPGRSRESAGRAV